MVAFQTKWFDVAAQLSAFTSCDGVYPRSHSIYLLDSSVWPQKSIYFAWALGPHTPMSMQSCTMYAS